MSIPNIVNTMTTNFIGKTLGQYKLVASLGEGGLATVYKAYQSSLERWVAVKVLYTANDSELLARFQREAKAVANLRHQNILKVYEYGQTEDWPYIVMELVEGGTLAAYLQRQSLDWIRSVKIALAVADALHYAHGQGLIHRDVKPSNILMAQDDWPLLADFGLVKMSSMEGNLTQTGLAIGTPSYMPPEQARGEKVDHRADMYSLGVIMFEMITGRLPFEYENSNLLMLAHISELPPSPREFSPACPPELEAVILTAMQKSPDDRYPDMQAMADDLGSIIDQSMTGFSAESSSLSGTPIRLSAISPPTSSNALDERTLSEHIPVEIAPSQVVRILLLDKNITIDLPDPGQDGLIIGRTHGQTRADIDLGPYGAAEAGISRHHAFLIRLGSTWLIDDMESLNGTYVNEVKITPNTPVPLKNGDVVRCSHLSFVFLLA